MEQEKWNYSETLYISGNYGYSSSIYTGKKSTVETDICEVWGKDKEEISQRLKLISKAPEMYEALRWAYEVLSRVDHSYTERNTHEGQMKLSVMRYIIKENES